MQVCILLQRQITTSVVCVCVRACVCVCVQILAFYSTLPLCESPSINFHSRRRKTETYDITSLRQSDCYNTKPDSFTRKTDNRPN